MSFVKIDLHRKIVNPFDIIAKLEKYNTGLTCDLVLISNKICERGVYQHVTSELLAEIAASMAANHPDYISLATKIVLSNLPSSKGQSLSETIKLMYVRSGPKDPFGPPPPPPPPLVTYEVYNTITKHAKVLEAKIVPERDDYYDYIGLKILERSYLLKINGRVVESPQHMLMRVAIGIHKDDIDSVIQTYQMMSEGWFTHASPTLFNAGTPNSQLSSCIMICMVNNSIGRTYDILKECAVVSESAGGIGVSVHNVESTGGTNATSSRIIPMLRVFNDTARFIDGEGGKRKTAITVYLEPWHVDVFQFLDLRKKHGIWKEEQRALDLSYALWVPDLFMKRVQSNGSWSLFCPSEAPGLANCWGEDFVKLYEKYEVEGKAKKVVKAMKLWLEVLKTQMETGMPHMLYKDSCNRKSNQQKLGAIMCSSPCAGIILYTSPTETAMCNLASIALPLCVKQEGVSQPPKLVGSRDSSKRNFDFAKLAEITSVVTRNLDKLIDVNFCSIATAEESNLNNRPIGIGVQGLADTFILLGMAYDSEEARKLNKEIFETIYYSALKTSCELAAQKGAYGSYTGSPVSEGILQTDMWKVTRHSGKWDWDNLRLMIKKNGVRNSQLVALVPTSLTSKILGNNECFAPITSNLYTQNLSGAHVSVVNKHLLHDLTEMGVWSPFLRDQIILGGGSVQKIPFFPEDLKAIYKTVWEINPETLVDMAVDRGCYIDQSQSLSIHIPQLDTDKLSSLHFKAWSKGLKTGMYYLRSKNAGSAINFTVDTSLL